MGFTEGSCEEGGGGTGVGEGTCLAVLPNAARQLKMSAKRRTLLSADAASYSSEVIKGKKRGGQREYDTQ